MRGKHTHHEPLRSWAKIGLDSLYRREHARIYKNDPQHRFTWGVEGNSSRFHIADCSPAGLVCHSVGSALLTSRFGIGPRLGWLIPGSIRRHSICVRSHISKSLEAPPDQFANAVGSTFQLMGDRFVAEADDPQMNGVLLAGRKPGQVVSHQLPLFLVQVDPLGIRIRAGMSREQQIEVGLRIQQIPPSRPL